MRVDPLICQKINFMSEWDKLCRDGDKYEEWLAKSRINPYLADEEAWNQR